MQDLTMSTPSRRGVLSAGLAGALGAVVLPSVGPREAQAATPPSVTPLSPRVGWTVQNSTGKTLASPSWMSTEFAAIKEARAGWVRLGIPMWMVGNFYGTPPTWYRDQKNLDALLAQFKAARAAGLRVVATLTAPPMAKADTDTFFWCTRTALEDFVPFFAPYVDVWQVMNEPDLSDYRYSNSFAGKDPETVRRGYVDELGWYWRNATDTIRRSLVATLGSTRAASVRITSALGGYPANSATWDRWATWYGWIGSTLDVVGVNAYPDPGDRAQMNAQAGLLSKFKARTGKDVMVLETGHPTPNAAMANTAVTAIPSMLRSYADGGALLVVGYMTRDRATGSTDGEDVFGLRTTSGARKAHWGATVNATALIR